MRLFIVVERTGGPSLTHKPSKFVARVYGSPLMRGEGYEQLPLVEMESETDAKDAVSKAMGQLAYFVDREPA